MSYETSQGTHRDLLERLLQVTATFRKELASLEEEEQPEINQSGQQEPTGRPVRTHVEPLVAAASDAHEVLEALAMEHEVLSVALREAGLSEDLSLLPLAEKVWTEVQEVIMELQAHCGRNRQALAPIKEQRRRLAAYVRAASHFSL